MDVLNFLKQSTLVHIWLWCIFVISALIVVAIQCCALVIWPFSRQWYRDINGEILKLFWFQYAWLADYWSGSELFLHCKDEDVPFAGREDGFFVLNHRSDVDWIIIWQLAARFNLLPTIIFCEGTRYTEEKYKLSQAFAKERGLSGLRHHLLPRTKGFALCVQAYRGKDVHIYDATLAYKGGKPPSLYDILCGKKYECHMYARRFPLDDVPSGAEDDFCHEMYQGKDKAFDYFLQHDSFVGFDEKRTLHAFPRPRLPLYIMAGWILVIGLPILYYTYTIAISGSVLKVLMTSAMFVGIIHFSRFIMAVTQSTKSSSYGLENKTR